MIKLAFVFFGSMVVGFAAGYVIGWGYGWDSAMDELDVDDDKINKFLDEEGSDDLERPES